MCKVCRLQGVLSLALFSYACRPNFHHKYLTLTDPLLSVCEEALISLHTCADRPKIRKLRTMYECVFSCVCGKYEWCSNYSASSLFLLFQPLSAFLLVCRTTQFAAERNHLYWRVTQLEDRLCFVSNLFFSPPLSASSFHQSWVRWGK